MPPPAQHVASTPQVFALDMDDDTPGEAARDQQRIAALSGQVEPIQAGVVSRRPGQAIFDPNENRIAGCWTVA